jgi:hypothetical protein
VGKEYPWRTTLSSFKIYIVTEGQTETRFVKEMLIPWFAPEKFVLIPCTVVTKIDKKAGKQYKGGISSYAKVKNDIKRCLSYTSQSNVIVTTMLDYYHLPDDTPGYNDVQRVSDPYEKVACIEDAIKADIQKNIPNPAMFVPYLQLHEFEALLFCNLDVLANHFFENNIQALYQALSQFKNPELINESEQTAPSKRILRCISNFDKVTDGVDIACKIGLDVLRKKCVHFNEWITKLENSESYARHTAVLY